LRDDAAGKNGSKKLMFSSCSLEKREKGWPQLEGENRQRRGTLCLNYHPMNENFELKTGKMEPGGKRAVNGDNGSKKSSAAKDKMGAV